jgi:hypothetical protein
MGPTTPGCRARSGTCARGRRGRSSRCTGVRRRRGRRRRGGRAGAFVPARRRRGRAAHRLEESRRARRAGWPRRSRRRRMQRPGRAAAACSSPSTSRAVPSSRLERMRSLLSCVQRWAIGAPARCTTPSRPASPSTGAAPASARQPTASTPSVHRAVSGRQGGNELRPDDPGGARNGDAHHRPLPRSRAVSAFIRASTSSTVTVSSGWRIRPMPGTAE